MSSWTDEEDQKRYLRGIMKVLDGQMLKVEEKDAEIERLRELLSRIKQHWKDGTHDRDNSWDGTMLDLLEEAEE